MSDAIGGNFCFKCGRPFTNTACTCSCGQTFTMKTQTINEPLLEVSRTINEYEQRIREDERAKCEDEIEALQDKLHQIQSWCQAYPLAVFPEPDWTAVKEKLGSRLLTEVSGSNMRHVVEGIQRIIDVGKP